MQPPPRKVKPTAALKNIHADQVSKLQAKHQQECDLLEDIRTFFLRKAALEKEYAQGLQKITTQLLKREFPAQPDLSSEDGLERKTVCTVWRSILEEADRMAKTRLQAADVYADKVAEPLKPAKNGKIQTVKKVLPQLSTIQAEVSQCVLDMVKSDKTYIAENGVAHDARQKSSEAEDKLKRKSTGIFQSLAGLQKNAAKLRSRTEASETKETAARNDYLLNLAAANAHHIRYYSTDLPDIIKTMDCDVYEKIQESLTIAGQTAAEIAQTENSSFQTIAVEAAKISQQFSHQCYLFQNPVFTNLVQYQFEPSHEDSCNQVSSDHGAGPELEKEARKWATRTAKETRSVRDNYRQLTLLQNSKSADRTSDSGTGSQENTSTDPEVKQEDIKQHIRKAETTKLKAEARLEALKAGGVNIDEWISQAQMESLAAEESGLARTPSQLSLRTESSGGHSMDDQEATYTNYDDDDDFIDDTFNTTGNESRSGRIYPIYCKALYDFEASNYDEMSIKAGEDLELTADGDGEGWIKAKNSMGQEGYIPETYVEEQSTSSTDDVATPVAVQSIQNITNHFSNASSSTRSSTSSQHSTNATAATTSPPDVQSPTSVDFTQDTTSSYSSGDLEVQQTTEVMASDDHQNTPVAPSLTVVTTSTSEIVWAKALYDYEAQAEEELSFLEGSLIKVLRKDDNGVDDGFWEGECNGCTGVFPSLVVEEIDTITPNDPTSPGSYIDYSNPPPVHITLPTPDGEPPPPPPLVNGEECDEPLPPPPPVLELEDVNRYESAQDSNPVAPPPPGDLDQTQQKRVRFFTGDQQQQNQNSPASSNPSHNNHNTEITSHSNTEMGGNRDLGVENHQINTLTIHSDKPQSRNQYSVPTENNKQQHTDKTVTEDHDTPGARTTKPDGITTPIPSLSRHQSLPNCNTADDTQPVKRSPLPLRSKSMMLSPQQLQQKQQQQQHRIPPGIPPPPRANPKRLQRQNEVQQLNQNNKQQKLPQTILKSRGGGGGSSVAHFPSSDNFVDKFLASPPLERRKTSTLPPSSEMNRTNTNLSNSSPSSNRRLNLQLNSTTIARPANDSHQNSPTKTPTPTQQQFIQPYFDHHQNQQQQQQHQQFNSPSKTPTEQQMWQNFQHQQTLSQTYHQENKQNQHDLINMQNSNGSIRKFPETNSSISDYQQQQTSSSSQQQYFSFKGQMTFSKSVNRRQDKLPLCIDVDDDEWESEEGEESLV